MVKTYTAKEINDYIRKKVAECNQRITDIEKGLTFHGTDKKSELVKLGLLQQIRGELRPDD